MSFLPGRLFLTALAELVKPRLWLWLCVPAV